MQRMHDDGYQMITVMMRGCRGCVVIIIIMTVGDAEDARVVIIIIMTVG